VWMRGCTFTAMCEHPLTKCNSVAILFVMLRRTVRQCVNRGFQFDLVSRRRMEIPTSNGLYARHIIFVICWLDSTSLSGSLIINSLLFSFEYWDWGLIIRRRHYEYGIDYEIEYDNDAVSELSISVSLLIIYY